jgi:hypothetical protein
VDAFGELLLVRPFLFAGFGEVLKESEGVMQDEPTKGCLYFSVPFERFLGPFFGLFALPLLEKRLAVGGFVELLGFQVVRHIFP